MTISHGKPRKVLLFTAYRLSCNKVISNKWGYKLYRKCTIDQIINLWCLWWGIRKLAFYVFSSVATGKNRKAILVFYTRCRACWFSWYTLFFFKTLYLRKKNLCLNYIIRPHLHVHIFPGSEAFCLTIPNPSEIIRQVFQDRNLLHLPTCRFKGQVSLKLIHF